MISLRALVYHTRTLIDMLLYFPCISLLSVIALEM